ncbi:lipoate--protein ligase family protein [Candidatus Woesearchaeota archaeon]|nr:lipoate--protein ligase family protein [Candidatus Woesearchaeota archaeon]
MKWRVIKLEMHDPYMNLALDETLTEFVGKEFVKPTIRFYGWKNSAVIIGYFQKMKDEVNLENCKKNGIEFVRRISGGGAVYQDNDGGLTYSVAVPKKYFENDISKCYRIVGDWIIDSLNNLGIKGEFKPINDITANNKKISGNALSIKNDCILVHGTLLYDLNVEKMFSFLNVAKEKISDKFISNVKERVTCVKDLTDVSKNDVVNALIHGFTKNKEFDFGEWEIMELKRAEFLSKNKFKKDEWKFMR